MNEKILNKAEADDIFRENAILFEDDDGVLASKAEELFGREAVAFVRKLGGGGEYIRPAFLATRDTEYLTLAGFRQAAGFRNRQLLV